MLARDTMPSSAPGGTRLPASVYPNGAKDMPDAPPESHERAVRQSVKTWKLFNFWKQIHDQEGFVPIMCGINQSRPSSRRGVYWLRVGA